VNHPEVSEYFRQLALDVLPTEAALNKVQTHAEQISKRLQVRFDVNRIMRVGSHVKGTAIRGYSDLDLFVVMTRDEARKWARDDSSRTLIGRVRNDLQERFPATTVRRDGQAVVVKFAQGDFAVDVVPAIFAGVRTTAVYQIPDGLGGWVQTSPEGQVNYLLEANSRAGNKVIPLVRMLKWWAQSREVTSPTKSLYLELLVPACHIPVGMSYPEAMAGLLGALAKHQCGPIQAPAGYVGPVEIAPTDGQKRSILSVVEASSERAVRAREAEARGNVKEALRLWDVILNHS
jgi:predicted nucleotidyltransferase